MMRLSDRTLAHIRATGDLETMTMLQNVEEHPYYRFTPRPDNPANYDEQTGFVESDALVTIACGGNGSGKTYCSAMKLAQFVLEKQAPPTRDTPFWIIANSYEQCCQTMWAQKLSNLIPHEAIEWDRITWHNSKRNWPASVPLKAWDGDPGKNWCLEFKSYEQGRELMQAAAIGGACFTEQFPWEIFQEVLRGCREYMFPGSLWAEFTPIDPSLSAPLEELYDRWLAGETEPGMYNFFRLNTDEALEAGHVTKGWHSTFYSLISEEMQATRRTGAFADYEGAVFQSFNPRIHVFDHPRTPDGDLFIPRGVFYRRGLDWGASVEHPLACIWAYKNSVGQYTIFDEFLDGSQNRTSLEQIDEIRAIYEWKGDDPHYGRTYGDPSRPDSIRLYTARGIPVSAANNAVHEGIETIRRHLKVIPNLKEPLLRIDRRNCPNLIKQLRTYRWLKSSGTGLNPKAARPEPLKRNDDLVDALRYLIHSDAGSPIKQFAPPITNRPDGSMFGQLTAIRRRGDSGFRPRA